MSTDNLVMSDKLKPVKLDTITDLAKKNVESISKKLDNLKLSPEIKSEIDQIVSEKARGPISNLDWETLDASKYKKSTQEYLNNNGLDKANVLDDPQKTETYVTEVFNREGIPTGNGDTEKVKATAGHFQQESRLGDGTMHETPWGADVVAARQKGEYKGVPSLLEVKNTKNPETRKLSNYDVQNLEPSVQKWREEREKSAIAMRDDRLMEIRSDANELYKPEVGQWRDTVERDLVKLHSDHLPVIQMDELWAQDRWLKIIKTPEGHQRMVDIGVDKRFLDYDGLASNPNSREWNQILLNRATVIVSDQRGSAGTGLTKQAILAHRSYQVMKIDM